MNIRFVRNKSNILKRDAVMDEKTFNRIIEQMKHIYYLIQSGRNSVAENTIKQLLLKLLEVQNT